MRQYLLPLFLFLTIWVVIALRSDGLPPAAMVASVAQAGTELPVMSEAPALAIVRQDMSRFQGFTREYFGVVAILIASVLLALRRRFARL